MIRELLPALRLAAATLALTGIAYPLAMTSLAHVLFRDAAGGRLVRDEHGAVVGSAHIGQLWTSPAYLQGRPSAAGSGYDAAASSGSNLGPTSQKLRDRVVADLERLRKENPDARGPVPAELVLASASGLDPHVSPQAALWQVPRVAHARQADPERVKTIVEAHVEPRQLGLLGEPRVNVLLVNVALDRELGRPAPPPVPR